VITDLAAIKRLAAEKHDDFQVMRYMLERDSIPDAELDTLVQAVAAPIVHAIDCLACGNCCKNLDVYLVPDDARRLAAGVDVPLDAIMTRYVDAAVDVEEWGKFRKKPCAFLDGNFCTVYAHRPQSCRDYPAFTPDFRWMLAHIIDGAGSCPIIYNVLVRMLDETERIIRRPN
jgi:uncharacterized protein